MTTCSPLQNFNFTILFSVEFLSYHVYVGFFAYLFDHRCDKRLQRLQKNLCKRVYYFVNVYLNKNHMSETKQNYDSDEDN